MTGRPRSWRLAWSGAVLLALAMAVWAQPPVLARAAGAAGTVRVWGNPQLGALVRQWALEFQKAHPGVRPELHMTGSDTGLAGLYTGAADIALLGREATDSELKAFEWIFRYPPLRLQIAHGSLDRPAKSPALVAFVHADVPLAQLSLAQLAGLLRPDAPGFRHLRTWGDLGIGGVWKEQTVHLYLDDTESGTGRFLRQAVLGGSGLLSWEQLTEFRERPGADGDIVDSRHQILTALAADRFGLAISSLPCPTALKVVPLVTEGAAVPASVDTLRSGAYPLGRPVYAYVNARAADRLDPNVRELLRFILGPDGQRPIAAEGYLPLTAAQMRTQLQQLQMRPDL